mmetsp:Transcript_33867/g.66024  ORF Transcript_33867/g.66024 Transcript_33867/m.66024 type:complete len:498 (+) Transcript_33867:229-1722(+)
MELGAVADAWLAASKGGAPGTGSKGGGKSKMGREQYRVATPGAARSDAERKQRQRLLEEETKRKLQDVLRSFQPPDSEGKEKRQRKRKLISPDEVAAEAIVRVREFLSKAEVDGARDARLRGAMVNSKFLGTILLRRRDLLVVESSEAMCLFASFPPLKGYRGQALEAVVHTMEAEALISLVQGAMPGMEGRKLTVRLLRLCIDESSGCLLNQYVYKELTLAHVSADRESVLLMCPMTDADTQPLTTTPTFWDEWFALAASQCNGKWRMVNASGLMEAVKWATGRGVGTSRAAQVGSTPPPSSGLMQRLWQDSMGFSAAMGMMMEEACPFYVYVRRDPGGKPRVTAASRLRHGGYETPWNQFLSISLSGELANMGILSGRAGLFHIGSVRLPEEGEPGQLMFTDIFVSRGLGGGGPPVVEGIWHHFYTPHGTAELFGHLRLGEGKIVTRHGFLLRDGDKLPNLEVNMKIDCKPHYLLPMGWDTLGQVVMLDAAPDAS